MARASTSWVPADSQMMVGLQPRRASSAMRGAGSGPKSVWSKVRWTFSPPLGVKAILEKWLWKRLARSEPNSSSTRSSIFTVASRPSSSPRERA